MKIRRPQCEPQYALINSKLIEVTILPQQAQGDSRCFAELREISRVSVTVVCTGQPELQPGCRISLASPKFEGVLVVPVEVLWVRPNPFGNWQLGCQIDPPLSDEYLAKLLTSGLFVRRTAPREPTRIPVLVQLEPEAAHLPALVRDISAGGLCLTTSSPARTTRLISIFVSTPEGEVRIPLEMRWSMNGNGIMHFIGCKFVQPADYTVLHELQPAVHERPHNIPQRESIPATAPVNQRAI